MNPQQDPAVDNRSDMEFEAEELGFQLNGDKERGQMKEFKTAPSNNTIESNLCSLVKKRVGNEHK